MSIFKTVEKTHSIPGKEIIKQSTVKQLMLDGKTEIGRCVLYSFGKFDGFFPDYLSADAKDLYRQCKTEIPKKSKRVVIVDHLHVKSKFQGKGIGLSILRRALLVVSDPFQPQDVTMFIFPFPIGKKNQSTNERIEKGVKALTKYYGKELKLTKAGNIRGWPFYRFTLKF